MNIDPKILAEILSQGTETIPIWENRQLIEESISSTEEQIFSLSSQLEQTKAQIKRHQKSWDDLKASSINAVNFKNEIDNIHSFIKEPMNTLLTFFNKNQNDIELLSEFNQLDTVLNLSSFTLQDDNIIKSANIGHIVSECEKNNYTHLLVAINERIEFASSKQRQDLYSQIEKCIQSFAVMSQNSLNAVFLSKTGLGIEKSHDFHKLIDKVSKIDKNWIKSLTELTEQVFLSRFLYHCSNSNISSGNSYISLITGLLRVTIQTAFIITNYLERLAPDSGIFNNISYFLLENGSKEVLSKNDGSCVFYRSLFEQSVILDRFLSSLEIYNKKTFSQLLFDAIGEEWITIERDTISLVTKSALSTNDFSFVICGALSKLVDAPPSSLTETQRALFVKKCIIPAERSITTLIADEFNSVIKDFKQASLILNSLLLVSAQLMEIYEIEDSRYQDLLQDSKKTKKNCFLLCEKFAQIVISLFEKEGGNYLISQSISWRNGSTTPSLIKALNSVSAPLAIVREHLDPTLFSNQYLPYLVKSIDTKVYKMIVIKIDWAQNGSIDQFVVDLDAMINIFGSEELRLLRSAKIFLTSKEEKYLNYEIPEEDVVKLMMAAKMANKK